MLCLLFTGTNIIQEQEPTVDSNDKGAIINGTKVHCTKRHISRINETIISDQILSFEVESAVIAIACNSVGVVHKRCSQC